MTGAPPRPPTAEEQVQFLANLQRLITETNTVATYKFALLLALADLSVERGWDYNGVSPTFEVAEIAEKFITYYWRQVRPFPARAGDELAVLKQNTGEQAKIVKLLLPEHAQHRGSLGAFRRHARSYATVLRSVAALVKEQPLWRLQRVGRRGQELLDFIYPNAEGGTTVTLRDGAAFCLRRFHPFIEHIVRASWVRFVRDLDDNAPLVGATGSIDEFLFGSRRGDLSSYVPILTPVQEGRCFYCRRTLTEEADVDHFVPWSLYQLDLAHNFVLTHKGCNNAKGDRLAAVEHLQQWVERNQVHRSSLATAFDAASLVHDDGTSERIAVWAYGQAEVTGAKVWSRGDDLEALPAAWRGVFAA